MVKVPPSLLDASLWKTLRTDALYTVQPDGELRPADPKVSSAVYNPSEDIPAYILCRTSDSTKRLEKGLEAVVVDDPEMPFPFGSLFTINGGGSPIGVLVELKPALFRSAHCTPDGVHLCNAQGEIDPESIIKPVYSYKTFRSFLIGPAEKDKKPHDVMLTAKARWFRKRNNPKFLGFSKDSKT
jgi:hypothetical protein